MRLGEHPIAEDPGRMGQAFAGPVGAVAVAFVIGIYVVGLIIYFIAAAARSREGVNLNLLYSEIPPE